MATVRLTEDAVEQYRQLPRVIRERVQGLLSRLEKWPNVSGCKPLTGDLAGWYRMRTGDYRLRFRLQGELVVVDKIGHGKDVYEA